MSKDVSIEVIGSINTDFIVKSPRFPKEGETITGSQFLTAPGGKGANQAVALSRLGAKVFFVGCAGDDIFGNQAIQALKKDRIDTTFIIKVRNQPTGTALITINNKAQNQIVVIPGANHKITSFQIESAQKKLRKKCRAVLLQLEIPIPIVSKAITLAQKDGLLTILNPAPATNLPQNILKYIDYLIPNEHEAKTISHEDNIENAAKKLLSTGVKNLIITLGDKGALFTNKYTRVHYIPAYKIKSTDPTAAGDAFVAAFTVALLQDQKLLEAIKFANAAGALATMKIGAQPSLPFFNQVENFIKTHS